MAFEADIFPDKNDKGWIYGFPTISASDGVEGVVIWAEAYVGNPEPPATPYYVPGNHAYTVPSSDSTLTADGRYVQVINIPTSLYIFGIKYPYSEANNTSAGTLSIYTWDSSTNKVKDLVKTFPTGGLTDSYFDVDWFLSPGDYAFHFSSKVGSSATLTIFLSKIKASAPYTLTDLGGNTTSAVERQTPDEVGAYYKWTTNYPFEGAVSGSFVGYCKDTVFPYSYQKSTGGTGLGKVVTYIGSPNTDQKLYDVTVPFWIYEPSVLHTMEGYNINPGISDVGMTHDETLSVKSSSDSRFYCGQTFKAARGVENVRLSGVEFQLALRAASSFTSTSYEIKVQLYYITGSNSRELVHEFSPISMPFDGTMRYYSRDYNFSDPFKYKVGGQFIIEVSSSRQFKIATAGYSSYSSGALYTGRWTDSTKSWPGRDFDTSIWIDHVAEEKFALANSDSEWYSLSDASVSLYESTEKINAMANSYDYLNTSPGGKFPGSVYHTDPITGVRVEGEQAPLKEVKIYSLTNVVSIGGNFETFDNVTRAVFNIPLKAGRHYYLVYSMPETCTFYDPYTGPSSEKTYYLGLGTYVSATGTIGNGLSYSDATMFTWCPSSISQGTRRDLNIFPGRPVMEQQDSPLTVFKFFSPYMEVRTSNNWVNLGTNSGDVYSGGSVYVSDGIGNFTEVVGVDLTTDLKSTNVSDFYSGSALYQNTPGKTVYSSSETVVDFENALSQYAGVSDLRVYVTEGGPYSLGGLGAQRFDCKFVTDSNAPSPFNFYLLDEQKDVVLPNGRVPKNGYFYLEGVSGSDGTDYPSSIDRIKIYVSGVLVLEIKYNAVSGANTSSWQSQDFQSSITSPINFKWPDYLQPTPSAYSVDVVGSTTNLTYNLTIPYIDKFINDYATTFVAVVENSVGMSTTATASVGSKVITVPKVDRMSVSPIGASQCVVAGNVKHMARVDKVRYSFDRRIPLVHYKFNELDSLKTDSNYLVSARSGWATKSGLGPYGSTTKPNSAWRFAGTVNSGQGLQVAAQHMTINNGTVDAWIRPFGFLENGMEYPVFQFNRKYGTKAQEASKQWVSDRDKIELVTKYVGGKWRVQGKITDTFGSTYTSEYAFDNNSDFTTGWNQVRMTWKINKAGKSCLKVFVNGVRGQSVLEETTIQVGLTPSVDLISTFTDQEQKVSDVWSNLFIGNNGGTVGFGGSMAEFRLLDVYRGEDMEYPEGSGTYISKESVGNRPWVPEEPTGFYEASSLQFDGGTAGFRFQVSMEPDEIRLVRLQPVDGGLNRPSVSLLNSSQGYPALIRGVYSGVQVSSSTTVNRYRLIDAQGEYPDFLFDLNPLSMGRSDSEIYQESLSIAGRRNISSFSPASRSLEMSWEKMKKSFYDQLEERAISGNSFFLIDHNDEAYYGKLKITGAEERAGNVPSRYNVSLTLIGQGGYYDYRLNK